MVSEARLKLYGENVNNEFGDGGKKILAGRGGGGGWGGWELKFGVWGFGELSKTSEVNGKGVKNGNKNKGLIT